MLAVLKHELALYYHGITAYIFGALLLVVTGIGAMLYNINSAVANFEYVLDLISIVFVIIVPIITMRILAEERKQKTDQLLYSLPISTSDVVLGKFLALCVIYAMPMVIICFYPLIFAQYGDVYLPTSYGCLVAFFFMGLALMSIGMFVSSITESQGMAAGICVAALAFNYFSSRLADLVSGTALGALVSVIVIAILLGLLIRHLTKSDYIGIGLGLLLTAAAIVTYFLKSEILEGLLPDVMDKLSLFTRFSVFVNGVFDVTGIVFYLSVIAFFLFLCVQSLEKRRYN